jgi:tetratricopeptide (TPR) repeat protein
MAAKYKAFISYTHADEAWAKWLQRALERYRVPGRLVQALRGQRELPRRLYPVFRDRSELSSSANLGSALEQSLADSEYLVVVCSPTAARSRWLNEEVRFFRSLGRAERVLCFVVEGDLEVPSPDCAFPPALLEADDRGRVVEPLAADPRADGKRDALLKIIGGLLAVGIDDLKQRDAQRRARVWAGVAAGAMVLAVAMVGLALYAIAAQREAELRRGQAENLIGFMLGDLRGKLQRIGRLDLLDSVGDASMDYFAALDENATPEDLLSRGMALRQIGEVRFDQGRLEPALEAFGESRAVLQTLHDADPAVDDYLFEMGQSEFWVGYVHYERLELDRANAAMDNYLDISNELLARQPDNPDYLAEVGYAYTNLGAVARKRNDQQAAIRYARQAAAIAEQQLEASPDDAPTRAALAESYSWLGSAEEEVGNLAASIDAFQQSLTQWQAVAASDDDVRHRERVASAALLLADAHLLVGAVDEAAHLVDAAYLALTELVALDPDNAGWRRGLAASVKDRAELEAYAGRHDAAVAGIEAALQQFGRLSADDPSDREIRQQIVHSLRVRAEILALAGRTDEARTTAEEALQRAMADAPEAPRDAALSTLPVIALYARLLDQAGRTDEADRLRRATWQVLADSAYGSPRILAPLAEIAQALGETEAARELAGQLRAAGCRHPAWAAVLGLEQESPPSSP